MAARGARPAVLVICFNVLLVPVLVLVALGRAGVQAAPDVHPQLKHFLLKLLLFGYLPLLRLLCDGFFKRLLRAPHIHAAFLDLQLEV